MKLWCILFGLFCLVLGILSFLFSKNVWYFWESWKTKGGGHEPSKVYLVLVKIVGLFLAVFGIAICVLPYLV